MNVALIFVVMVAALVVTCAVLIGIVRGRGKRIKALETELDKARKNIAYLVRHAQEIADVRGEKDSVNSQIEEAKTDEEIADIVAAVIDANNSRVRDKD